MVIYKRIFAVVIWMLFLKSLTGQGVSEAYGHYNYRIQPIPKADRTELVINLEFNVGSDTAFTIGLPQDCYGTPDYYRFIKSIKALEGASLIVTGDPGKRWVKPNKQLKIHLQYIISPDPGILETMPFGVSSSATHFHFAGCQWLLVMGDPAASHLYNITIKAPGKWNLYNSMSKDPANISINASYNQLASTAIGGGSQPYRKMMIMGKPVYAFIAGTYEVETDTIFNAIEKIVTAQRSWFRDSSADFFTVVINPRPGIIAGTCITNLFVCFIKPGIKPGELNGLLSHEMFHTWLPNKMKIKREKGTYGFMWEWFEEGLTEYFARKILQEAGLLNNHHMVKLFNRDIIDLADNPYSNHTYEALVAVARSGGGGTALKKLSYYRGALLTLGWEHQLKLQGGNQSLKDFILKVYTHAQYNNGIITPDSLFDIGLRYGLPVKNNFDDYIINGKPIDLPAGIMGPGFIQKEKAVASFDISFALQETFRAGKIKGVVENGPAWQAGLRNEMEFISIKNSNRFGNGWKAEEPVELTVKENGEIKVFNFFPIGKEMQVLLYYPAL